MVKFREDVKAATQGRVFIILKYEREFLNLEIDNKYWSHLQEKSEVKGHVRVKASMHVDGTVTAKIPMYLVCHSFSVAIAT